MKVLANAKPRSLSKKLRLKFNQNQLKSQIQSLLTERVMKFFSRCGALKS